MSERDASGEDRLESLRGDLRSLGYLEGYLERYLVRDLFARPGLLAPALRASSRAALFGGPLLALALSACLTLWHPALRDRPLDVVVLGAYVTLVAGLACFALLLAAAVLGLTAPARPAALGRAVGMASTLLWLAWLLSWAWLQGQSEARLLPALALGALALVLGRLAGLTALVIALDRASVGARVSDRHVARNAIAKAIAVLALASFSLALLALFGARLPQPPPSAPIRAALPGIGLDVLAIDGLGLAELGPALGAAGRRLQTLAGEGALLRLEPGAVPVPPVVWTTVATGRDPLDHGVRSLLVERVPGLDTAFPAGYGRSAFGAVLRALVPVAPPQAPLSDELRREKGFWEVAAEGGLEVLVVNWWATYPATIPRGALVSDRAYATLASGRELDREVAPPELGRALRLAGSAAREDTPESLKGASAEAFRSDRFHAEVALARRDSGRARLSAVYLQALDVISAGGQDAIDAARARLAYGDWLDSVLARLVPAQDSQRALAIIALPGRSGQAEEGFLLGVGAPFRPVPAGARAELVDLAPTLLVLLGLPYSEEQRGRPRLELLDPTFLREFPPRSVASFGRRLADPAPALDPTDEVARERLRALGYVN